MFSTHRLNWWCRLIQFEAAVCKALKFYCTRHYKRKSWVLELTQEVGMHPAESCWETDLSAWTMSFWQFYIRPHFRRICVCNSGGLYTGDQHTETTQDGTETCQKWFQNVSIYNFMKVSTTESSRRVGWERRVGRRRRRLWWQKTGILKTKKGSCVAGVAGASSTAYTLTDNPNVTEPLCPAYKCEWKGGNRISFSLLC